VVLQGEWSTVHHRARIPEGVRSRGDRDVPHLAVRRPEFVHVPAGDERAHLRRREEAEGENEAEAGGRCRRRLPAARPAADAAETAVLTLAERSHDRDTARRPGVDRLGRVRHRRTHTTTPAIPHHARQTELRAAEGGGQTGRIVAVVRVGGEAVELVRREARVGAGGDDRLAGELELASIRDPAPPSVLTLPDPHNAHPVPHGRAASPAPPGTVNRGGGVR